MDNVAAMLTGEDLLEVLSCHMGKLLFSGIGSIRVLKMGDDISSSSLDNRLIKEGGVSVTRDGPVLFVSLAVESFLLGKDGLMLEDEFFLGGVVLMTRWSGLMKQELVLNSFKLVTELRLGSSPGFEINSKKVNFFVEGSVG